MAAASACCERLRATSLLMMSMDEPLSVLLSKMQSKGATVEDDAEDFIECDAAIATYAQLTDEKIISAVINNDSDEADVEEECDAAESVSKPPTAAQAREMSEKLQCFIQSSPDGKEMFSKINAVLKYVTRSTAVIQKQASILSFFSK
ncbi:hypothetical protein CAPTEDRAFT_208212 [Capitella teleta]|uniref:Uncharacterized protein n=1 Tax=Capitella teleta TaxID=283909 RepID=R7T5I4_CAPTE|nr:hypothetical protein CAPTEDRAFT_208212 [Capitella teleta]|eukprot:ELT88500.1 hypothetical protein CAPTEDRAFT_208212 [Capitella teleta]